MFLLDSNIYIDAFNDPTFGAEFRRFHQANLPQLVLSAVVVHEILVGANDSRHRRTFEQTLLEPFRTRRRIHVPSMRSWELAAEIDRGLRELGGFAGSLGRRSFANDMLLAASARDLGATIVTRNLGDFRIIARVMPIRCEPPWP
jgi:predicted nucleic acid-binding protein